MTLRITILLLAWCCVSAFSTQPLEERTAQDALPQSSHKLWQSFAACKVSINQKSGFFQIAYSDEVKAMDGTQVTVHGFILPLEAKVKFSHLLLSKRTPTCPFCPPGEPNEVVEVFTKEPMEWREDMIALRGTLTLVNDGDKGIFFRLNDATIEK
ncbi:MAG: DUF3299 domain-containing protein [Rickettsiales bacterium]|nr:DUF3299 domain-containing protein [Rickettsiales bacterium]